MTFVKIYEQNNRIITTPHCISQFLFINIAYRAARPRKIDLVPPDQESIERAREERMKELKMYDIFREITFYAFFLWILMVVSYSFRDPKAYIMRNNMRYTFIDQGLGHIDTFVDDFYKVGHREII